MNTLHRITLDTTYHVVSLGTSALLPICGIYSYKTVFAGIKCTALALCTWRKLSCQWQLQPQFERPWWLPHQRRHSPGRHRVFWDQQSQTYVHEPATTKATGSSVRSAGNSGTSLGSLSGSLTGVYMGNFAVDYQPHRTLDPDYIHRYTWNGIDFASRSLFKPSEMA
jgi:hypothetical protein